MFSTEGFEVVESVICFMFQVIDVFCPGHIALEDDSKEGCFFTEGELLVVEGQVDVGLQMLLFGE